ncbi:hypothetical protein BaRGS_00026091 [Batillaria attramentaria]|uniref:Tubulin polyglutamylase ttll-15 n=1 Tax=Batillaria attramentaria TaxID=370345 RepID=A0ABD0K6F1_9CAEN
MYQIHQSPRFSRRRWGSPSKFQYLVIFVLVVGVTITFLNIYELHHMKKDHMFQHSPIPVFEGTGETPQNHPVVWIHGKNVHSGYLKHVFDVFGRLGYASGDENSDWAVLWDHDYPFSTLSEKLAHLKPHQRVNHFPGTGYVTNKVSLAVSKLKFIPKAFKLPDDKDRFLAFSKDHPDMIWVQKANTHRGIEIKPTSELDLSKKNTFIQEFVDKPFLIDGHKFDIGIYTIITSINPLRLYIIQGDALIRFCPDEYYPFDSKARGKYVVHDDYLPMWKVPSLSSLYQEKGFTFKETLIQYMKSKGLDYERVWKDMISVIQTVYSEKEHKIIQSASKFISTHHFFELVRFDFVLDEKLNVYLMEVNMSPNLDSGHFPPNKRLYEHVLYNLLQLVGVAQYVSPSPLDFEDDMRVSSADIHVFPEMCISSRCSESCSPTECKLCKPCLSHTIEKILKIAYLEHMRRGSARRVFPPSINQTQALKWDPSTEWPGLEAASDRNKLMHRWFVGKCRLDETWCL